MNPCLEDLLRAVAIPRPDFVPVLADEFRAAGAISELIVERQVTWAEAARRAQVLSSDVRQKVAAADLPWNPGHRDIQEPLQALLRAFGRRVAKAAALTLDMLRQLLATCDRTACGRRDRALLLIGFAAALRRSELVSLHVEDVVPVAGGLRLRISREKPTRGAGG